MGVAYLVAAVVVVPALLGVFRLLSRPPDVTSQPRAVAPLPPAPVEADRIDLQDWTNVADEAERWLRSQSNS